MTTQLITANDIAEVKSLSTNINELKKVNTQIIEAQEFDLRPFLGEEFYLAIEADAPGFSTYGDLWNGVEYTCGNDKFRNPGLKIVLIYYAYARILKDSNIHSTAFGMVNKLNEDSQSIDNDSLQRIIGQAVSGAKSYEARVRDYLIRKSELYPKFECTTDNHKSGGIRVTPVRKDRSLLDKKDPRYIQINKRFNYK